MCERIVIYGCGGHARSVLSTLEENEVKNKIIFVDDNAKPRELIGGHKVLSKYELCSNDYYHVAIGDNVKREKVFNELLEKGIGKPLSIISRHAVIRENSRIGKGVFISALAYIGPEASVGNNTIINTASVIEHETWIGSNCHIAPKSLVCGRSKIGSNTFIGAGATVIDKINICENVVVGAGAVVIRDIGDEGIYVGVPTMRLNL